MTFIALADTLRAVLPFDVVLTFETVDEIAMCDHANEKQFNSADITFR